MRKFTNEEYEAALKLTLGNATQAAKHLGVTRGAVVARENRNPDLKELRKKLYEEAGKHTRTGRRKEKQRRHDLKMDIVDTDGLTEEDIYAHLIEHEGDCVQVSEVLGIKLHALNKRIETAEMLQDAKRIGENLHLQRVESRVLRGATGDIKMTTGEVQTAKMTLTCKYGWTPQKDIKITRNIQDPMSMCDDEYDIDVPDVVN